MSSPESEIDLKRKRRLESVEEKPNLKLLKLDSSEVDAANYKECTKLFDNPEDVVQGWFILAFIFLFTFFTLVLNSSTIVFTSCLESLGPGKLPLSKTVLNLVEEGHV